MSAVEQARKELFLAISSCMLGGSSLVTLAERLDAAVDNYRTAVRAERDAAWREGVAAVRGTMPGINKRPDEVSNDAFYETRGMENALAALAARMEAK